MSYDLLDYKALEYVFEAVLYSSLLSSKVLQFAQQLLKLNEKLHNLIDEYDVGKYVVHIRFNQQICQ